jgi:hypothetical protein
MPLLPIWDWDTHPPHQSDSQAQAQVQAAGQQNILSGLGVLVDDVNGAALAPGHIQPGGGRASDTPMTPLYSAAPNGGVVVHQLDGDYVWDYHRSCWVNMITGSFLNGSFAPSNLFPPPPTFSVPIGEDSLPQLDRIEARLQRLEAMLKTLVE